MAESTRLKYIAAKNFDVLTRAVEALPFKVEIKGNPVLYGKKWVIYFVIPDWINWESVDLT